MVDRVQVLKQESAALGGDSADSVEYPNPISPLEDAIEARRYYIQNDTTRDETVYVDRNAADNLLFVDTKAGSRSLLDLVRQTGIAGDVVVTYSSGDVTLVSLYTDMTHTVLLSTVTIVYSGGNVSTITEREYTSGVETTRHLTTLSYSSGDVTGVVRVKQL